MLVPDNDADLVPGTQVTYHLKVTNTGTANAVGVTITDNLPVGQLTYAGSFSSIDGTWTTSAVAGAQTVVFALTGALLPNQSRTVAIPVNVADDLSEGTSVINPIVADADNAPPAPADHTSGSQPEADLTIRKEFASATPSVSGNPVAGGQVTYDITVTNNGPSVSPGTVADPITVQDTLDAGLNFVSLSTANGWSVASQSGQVVNFSYPNSIAVGASVTFTVTVSIDDDVVPASGTINLDNAVVVDGPFNNDPTNDDDDETITVVDLAAVTIVKTATTFTPTVNGNPVAGGQVTYTLQVTNAGPSEARNVVVTDLIPADFALISMTGTGWETVSANTVRYIGDLPVGAAAPITVVGTIAANYAAGLTAGQTRDLDNTAEVTWTDGEGPKSDEDDETVEVEPSADLALVKTPDLTEAIAGEEITYTIEVTNNGLSAADGPLTVVDQIPTGTSFVRLVSTAAEWTGGPTIADPMVLEFTRATGLGAGATAGTFDVVLLVDSAAFSDGITSLTNVATVSSPTPDPDPTNNTDDPTTLLNESADLEIVKTHVGNGLIDRDLQFGIVVTNHGPSDARNVVVVETLPVGLEYVDIVGSDAAWSAGTPVVNGDGTTTVTLTLTGDIAANAVAPILVVNTLVHVEAYPSVINLVEVDSDTPDPEPTNNEDPDPVDVDSLVQLEIQKSSSGVFQVGGRATYEITVINHGVTEDPGPIVVTDVLPSGLTFRNSTSADVTGAGQNVSYTHPTALAVGDSFSFTFEVNVLQAAFPTVTNIATVDTPSELHPDSILEDDVTDPVLEALADTGYSNAKDLFALTLLFLGSGMLLLTGVQVQRMRRRQATR